MDVEITCPLGSECETIKDNKLHRCAWYTKLSGTDPQSGKDIDDWRCAIAWQPILLIEGNGMSRGIGASIQSLRNETVKRQDVALGVIKNAKAITNK